LHNPRYAGAIVYGRRRTNHIVGISKTQKLPQEEWHTLIPNAHACYISWENYENNQKKLRENAQANGADRRKSPPREGPALLQGLIACGICGRRMTLRYHNIQGKLVPTYLCQQEGIKTGNPLCQTIPGQEIDKAIGNRLVEIVSPQVLELALAVQQELDSRLDQTDLLRQQQVERTKYEADLAKRRYMQTDPDNRLVAATLEADWNSKLKAVDEAQRELEKQRTQTRKNLDDEKRGQILALANNFSLLWNDEGTTNAERKKIVRLLIEDVTLQKKSGIIVHIRYKGGKLETLNLPKPLHSWQLTQTHPEVLQEMDKLIEDHTHEEVAEILNKRGRKTGCGLLFNARLVASIAKRNGLKSRYEHLRNQGLLSLAEMAEKLKVNPMTIKKWHKAGLIQGSPYNSKNECLYIYKANEMPTKMLGVRFTKRKKQVSI
jgi:hypothetical protein